MRPDGSASTLTRKGEAHGGLLLSPGCGCVLPLLLVPRSDSAAAHGRAQHRAVADRPLQQSVGRARRYFTRDAAAHRRRHAWPLQRQSSRHAAPRQTTAGGRLRKSEGHAGEPRPTPASSRACSQTGLQLAILRSRLPARRKTDTNATRRSRGSRSRSAAGGMICSTCGETAVIDKLQSSRRS